MTITVFLLGMAQDGGLPQPGCQCSNCLAARANPAQRQMVVSLGVVDEAAGKSWLIDATPDFPAQYDFLAARAPVAGIMLTHAHMGHYPGLLYLGPEAMNARAMPVHATERMLAFLRAHEPWSSLFDAGHLVARASPPGQVHALTPELRVTPIPVPHRDEQSDTVAWLVQGPQRSLFFCPDIDHWRAFDPDLRTWLQRVDIALLDGTFFSREELPTRNITLIPHPLVSHTAGQLAGTPTDVLFIHLNHTNPLWQAGPEQQWLRARGFSIGTFGQSWCLGK
jgi:pyrroloquinoline quinone biosynthesis protein B